MEISISMAKFFDQTVKQFTAWITNFAFMLIDLIVKVVLVRYLAWILQPGRHADQLGCKIFAKKSGPTSSEQGFLAEHDHKDRLRAEARSPQGKGATAWWRFRQKAKPCPCEEEPLLVVF